MRSAIISAGLFALLLNNGTRGCSCIYSGDGLREATVSVPRNAVLHYRPRRVFLRNEMKAVSSPNSATVDVSLRSTIEWTRNTRFAIRLAGKNENLQDDQPRKPDDWPVIERTQYVSEYPLVVISFTRPLKPMRRYELLIQTEEDQAGNNWRYETYFLTGRGLDVTAPAVDHTTKARFIAQDNGGGTCYLGNNRISVDISSYRKNEPGDPDLLWYEFWVPELDGELELNRPPDLAGRHRGDGLLIIEPHNCSSFGFSTDGRKGTLRFAMRIVDLAGNASSIEYLTVDLDHPELKRDQNN